MSLLWQAALDPSAGAAHVPGAPACPCLTCSCETRSSQCTTGPGTRTAQLVIYQVLKHPSFPPSLTRSLFISSTSFTQAAGFVLAAGTGQCCQSRLTETWAAAGQHSWPKEKKGNIVPAGGYSWAYPLSQTTCLPTLSPKGECTSLCLPLTAQFQAQLHKRVCFKWALTSVRNIFHLGVVVILWI